MANHVRSFFSSSFNDSEKGNFHKVIAVHETSELTWRDAKRLIPRLPKGWYELCRLASRDRIDFVRDYWLSKLPFQPGFNQFVDTFFAKLEEIGVYLTQRTFDDPYEVHFVYAIKGDGGFFQGNLPALEGDVVALQKLFPGFVLPADYLAFLQLHDGFAKFTDTGIIPSSMMGRVYRSFQDKLEASDQLLSVPGDPINPKTLIPFYESFGFPCYQCFWAEWYPAQEMGNVYYSGLTHTITDHTSGVASPENQAFPTFLDWLMFYLEVIEA